MSDHNKVHLHGLFNLFRSGAASGDKKAWVRGSIKPSGDRAFIGVIAFGATAESLGNAHELTVTVEGHLEGDKPREPVKGVPWPLIVVAEKVTEHAPRGHAQDSEPF